MFNILNENSNYKPLPTWLFLTIITVLIAIKFYLHKKKKQK